MTLKDRDIMQKQVVGVVVKPRIDLLGQFFVRQIL